VSSANFGQFERSSDIAEHMPAKPDIQKGYGLRLIAAAHKQYTVLRSYQE